MTDAVRIRPAQLEDAAAIARLQVDSYRTAYAGIFPQDYLHQFSYHEQEQERDWIRLLASPETEVVLVAEAGDGGLAGYALSRPRASYGAGYDSELQSLHVRRALHRQGIGPRLVFASAAHLAAADRKPLMLWVLEANPARGFYERLGPVRLEGRKETVGAYEVAYGWPDIRAIATLTPRGDG